MPGKICIKTAEHTIGFRMIEARFRQAVRVCQQMRRRVVPIKQRMGQRKKTFEVAGPARRVKCCKHGRMPGCKTFPAGPAPAYDQAWRSGKWRQLLQTLRHRL